MAMTAWPLTAGVDLDGRQPLPGPARSFSGLDEKVNDEVGDSADEFERESSRSEAVGDQGT